MASNGEKRECKFVMPPKKKPKEGVIPKVKDLTGGPATKVPPPEKVMRKLGDASMVVGVDIETADWVERKNNTSKGQFGFYHFCHPDDYSQKIVQIGWALGGSREGGPLLHSNECLVQPVGFAIAEKATQKHGISQDDAMQNGRPLVEVLTDFMIMIDQAEAIGARLVAHHLEFDAGIIDRQLHDAGLDHKSAQWREFARKGFCTMDPDVGAWAQRCMGRDVSPDERSAPMMSLRSATNLLLPKTDLVEHLQKYHHTAGADAQLHRLLYIALRSLVRANQEPQTGGPAEECSR